MDDLTTALEPVRVAVERIENETRLDALVSDLDPFARALNEGKAGSVLRGEWLGHALHPMLTDIPIGCWTSSFILDVVGGARSRHASQRLIGLGLLSMVPTAAAGAVDWIAMPEQKKRRVGVVHAGSNTLAGFLYLLSWQARRKGRHLTGVALGFAGGAVASVGGYLGGYLAFGGTEESPQPS